MKKTGGALIGISLIGTLIFFALSKSDLTVLQMSFLLVAQITALLGMIFFCYSFLLASRFSFLEKIFGGLDKVYKLHQITGRLSFILIVAHFIFLVFNYIGSSVMLSLLILPGKALSYNLGIAGLWSMCLIMTALLYLAIDYQWFVKIQDFFIIPFTLGVLHMLLASSDAARYLPLTIFLLAHVGIAYISWIYRVLLYHLIGPRFEYIIESVQVFPNDVITLALMPISKKMSFMPGQFAYVKFLSLGITQEFHPFSIASSPLENRLYLAVKATGDFTTQVKTLKVGDKATLMGPHGRLCERFFGKKDAVCIAGGIGITPFLSLISYFKDSKISEVKNLHVFYSVKNEAEALFEGELEKAAAVRPNLSLKCIHTERDGRLSVEMIRNSLGELRDKLYFLCGPKLMMEDLTRQLKNMSIPAKNIIYEDFSFNQ